MADPQSPTSPQPDDELLASLTSGPSSPGAAAAATPPPVPPKHSYVGSRLNPGAMPRSRPSSRAVSSSEAPPDSLGANRGSMVLYRLASEESQQLLNGQTAPLAVPPPSHQRFSRISSTGSIVSLGADRDSKYPGTNGPGTPPYAGAFVPYEYDPDDDLADAGEDDRLIEAKTYGWNARGAMNVAVLLLLTSAIVSLFTVYPVLSFFLYGGIRNAISNNVQVNATGQAPVLATIPKLVDDATPDDVKHRQGFDGHEYELVFSDEFNTDNRSFAPGDDPFWEAVDLYYWPTKDMQWYDPDQVTTADGFLRIKLEQIDPTINHDLSLKSGMLQSWNKFCFTNGYIEIRAQLPGPPNVAGYWPGAWTMGNLARPGYGATSDGTWPYTYDTCDVGIVRNQSFDGVNPPAAFNLDPSVGRSNYNYELSWLAGQKINACTCEGEDHPGPRAKKGRGAPEIDILEAEKDKHGRDGGSVSQSAQFAPFSANYLFDESQVEVITPDITQLNNYKGSAVQQAVSALTETSDDIYNAGRGGGQFGVFGFEYFGDPNDPTNSYITWVSEGKQTFTMRGTSIGPDLDVGIGQRLISPEPMAIMLNLAVSTSFQPVELELMTFPAEFLIDYVRVYQRKGSPETAIGCDPPDYPTLDYINRHINAYTNPNLTTWAMAGYSWPQNTLQNDCT